MAAAQSTLPLPLAWCVHGRALGAVCFAMSTWNTIATLSSEISKSREIKNKAGFVDCRGLSSSAFDALLLNRLL